MVGNYEEDYPALHPESRATTVGAPNSAVITAVPEPASLGLMLAGLAGIGTVMRRRRKEARSALERSGGA